MEYIEHNGIAIQYPKSLNQMAREFAVEANRISVPNFGLGVYPGGYMVLHAGETEPIVYDLEDMVP